MAQGIPIGMWRVPWPEPEPDVAGRSQVDPGSSTTERIHSAAIRLFVVRSYAEVTLDQVAEQAGLTKGAIYHHFKGKEALYLAVLLRELAAFRELHEGAAGTGGGSVDGRLRALTEAFLSQPPLRRQTVQLVRRDAQLFRPPTRRALIEAYQAAVPGPIEEILRDGVRSGELVPCNPKLLSWQFVALFEVLLSSYAEQIFPDAHDGVDYLLSIFLRGCARDRGALDQSP
jgi:AcrR family transcriptional regulator